MNEHAQISDLLPLYAAGALDRDQRLAVEQHLPTCGECQADLTLWKSVGGEVTAQAEAQERAVAAPRDLAERALAQIHRAEKSRSGAWLKAGRIFQLLRSQMPLVQREIWPASAAVIGMGYIIAVLAARTGVVYALAPLIAAACVSLIYGPDNDPGYELALSTPTSPRQILLARLVLVFGYNLVLVVVATIGLAPVLNQPLLGSLTLTWLAPMTFLSAAALVLSLWVGASNAIILTYVAWLADLIFGPLRTAAGMPEGGIQIPAAAQQVMAAYQGFWQMPILLLGLSALLFALAIWLAGRQSGGQLTPA